MPIGGIRMKAMTVFSISMTSRWASLQPSVCGWTAGNLGQGFVCGYSYALAYKMPLNGVNAQFGHRTLRDLTPPSTKAQLAGALWKLSCTPVQGIGCWHYDFGGDGTIDSAVTYTQMTDNRDAYITWIGLATGIWQWNSDNGPEADFR